MFRYKDGDITNLFRLHIKADMPSEVHAELVARMHAKVNARLIYTVTKLVDYCAQMYKSLPFSGYK